MSQLARVIIYFFLPLPLPSKASPHMHGNNQESWFHLITPSHNFTNCLVTGEPSAKHAHSGISGSSFHLLLILVKLNTKNTSCVKEVKKNACKWARQGYLLFTISPNTLLATGISNRRIPLAGLFLFPWSCYNRPSSRGQEQMGFFSRKWASSSINRKHGHLVKHLIFWNPSIFYPVCSVKCLAMILTWDRGFVLDEWC